MDMNMNFNLNLTQEQKLVMTQEMQLSVKLLQMSSIELIEHVEKEVQENPVLEVSYEDSEKQDKIENRIDYKEFIKYLDFDKYGQKSYEKSEDEEVSPFNFIWKEKSLNQYLKDQISYLNVKGYLRRLCEYIVDNLDERGYIADTIEEIAIELNKSEKVVSYALSLVQSLDPPGIGARDIKECLKLQLRRKNISDKEIFIIIDEHLQDIAENKYSSIAKALNIELKKAQDYGDIIKTLEPKPSRGFYTGDDISYIVPDAYIKKVSGEYQIILNDSMIPRLNINERYKVIINQEKDKEAVEYVKNKLNSALFLIKSIEHRKSTIYTVLEKIVEFQKDYFEYGESHLKPMTLKDISESINMHESTVSRAIKDKYINIDKGVVRIKDLFTSKISSNNLEDVSTAVIKKNIEELINKEDKSKPLSDQALCGILNKKAMNISRRTVAKYREEMNIKPSSKRKRF